MTRETKYVSFGEFKARTEGPGGWEGYLSKTGEIDDGGDLIVEGAYQDTIPEFLQRGFNAESHDWRFSTMIGFPTSAKEDAQGLYVTSQYHSTPDAQLVRQKAKERMDAGLGVYMSIGYEVMPKDTEIIEPDDYGKVIPEFSRKGLSEQNLIKALQFPFIRLIKRVTLFEGSIVSVPMLRSAEVTAVKSGEDEGQVDSPKYTADLCALVDDARRIADRTEKRITLRTKEGRVLSSANVAELSSAADELETLLKRIRTLLESATPKPKQEQEDDEKAIAGAINTLMADYYARQKEMRALQLRR